MVEPLVSYLESTVPTVACEMAIVFRSARLRLFCLSRPTSSTTLSFLRHFLQTAATTMARKKTTTDELNARAKANSYQRDAHRDKDNLRDQNKYADKVKKDQDAALHRYVL